MFKGILVAFDGSQSERALSSGIELAKRLNADLKAVYVYETLPPYAAGYMDAGVTGASVYLSQHIPQYYERLKTSAQQAAARQA